MAFPVLLASSEQAHAVDDASVSKPFMSAGGKVYVVGVFGSNTDFVRIISASDPTSSFSEVASWNPASSSIDTVSARQSGDTLYIAFDAAGSHFGSFDMATDTWDVQTSGSGYSNQDCRVAAVAQTATGGVHVMTGDNHTSMGKSYERIWAMVITRPATWSSPIAVDHLGTTLHSASPAFHAAVTDSTGRVHIFYGTSAGKAYSCSFSGTTRTAQVEIGTTKAWDVAEHTFNYIGPPCIYMDGATEKIAVVYTNASNQIVSRSATVAASLSWSAEQAVSAAAALTSGGNFNYDGTSPSDIVNENDVNLHAVWIDSASGDVYTDSKTVAATTWGTDSDRNDTTAIRVWANCYVRDGYWRLGYVYHESGGSTYYNEVQLSAVATPSLNMNLFDRHTPRRRMIQRR